MSSQDSASQIDYRLLVEEVRDYAIFRLNREGYILTWNAGARRLKGYTSEEIIGKHFSIFYSATDLKDGKPARELEIAKAEGRVEDEGWRLRKDGSRFWANVVITALRDPEGRLIGFAKVTRDMTDQRAAEEALRHQAEDLESRVRERTKQLHDANLALEQSDRMKDEFLATLSHELRTPLTAIMGWVQMLRSHQLDAANVEKALEVIDRNIAVQAQLIDDLLNISRIISGKVKLDARLCYPAPVVLDAVDTIRPSVTAKTLELKLDLDPTLGPLNLDAGRFQQIVWNLLTNAVKFTPSGGEISVTLVREGNEAVLQVADSGEGIRPDFLPYVFDRFRQGDASRSRRHGGLGLGLAIARQLVELHGGRISVSSDGIGCGCTFKIILPIPPLAAAVRDNLGFQERPLLQDVRVLVLEDQQDALDMVVTALEQHGALVQSASSVSAALSILEGRRFDIIISDIGMPDVDGYTFMHRVRAHPDFQKAMRAIALTAYASDEDRARALTSGFDAHLAKPVALNKLVRTITDLLPKRIA